MTIADSIASRYPTTLADLLLDMYTAGYDAALGNVSAPTTESRADDRESRRPDPPCRRPPP